jgi:hypothetical protein
MKAKFLKIAGVKTDKEFYKKYPTEAAFFKAHPEAKASIKKARIGSYMGGDTVLAPEPVNYQDYYDAVDKQLTGTTAEERLDIAAKQAQIAAASKPSGSEGGGGGFDIGSIASMFGGGGEGGGSVGEGIMSSGGFGAIGGGIGGGKNGKYIPRAQFGNSGGIPSSSGIGYAPGAAQQFGMNQFNPAPAPVGLSQLQQPFNPQPLQHGNGPISNAIFDRGGVDPTNGGGFMNTIGKLGGPVGGLAQGFKAIDTQRDAMRSARQAEQMTKLALDAKKSESNAPKNERIYVRPEDKIIQNNQVASTYGSGTNILSVKNGTMLRSGGEIQNTYAPNNLYDDLGYDYNDEDLKQYYKGGDIPKAAGGGGFSNFMGGGGTGMLNNMVGQGFNNNAGYQIGSSVGNLAAMIPGIGPVAAAIAGPVLGGIGGAIDNAFGDGRATANSIRNAKRNQEELVNLNVAGGITGGLSQIGVGKNGGYMNPEYNPQVITMFGDHTAKDFADYAKKDQFRAGGHLKSYTPPSERAMEIYEDGGEIKTNKMGGISIESGGYLEPISWNPYTGGTGFTSKFHGQSHVEQDPDLDHTGIIMKYGGNADGQDGYQMEEGGDAEGNRIEAERGEYISERKDGGEAGESAQISGNRRYNPKLYDLGPKFNKEFKDMKVKAIQGKIAEDDRKINIKESKNSKELTSFDPKTPQDKLYEGSLIANQLGYQMQYGINAAKANNILGWQNSVNDTVDEISAYHGKEINGDDFVKSGGTKINYEKESLDSSKSKNGNKFMKAEEGITIDPGKITKAQRAAYLAKGYKQDPKNPNRLYLPGTSKEVITKIPGSEAEIKKGSGPIKDTYKGPKMSNADWAAFLKTKQGQAYKEKYITGTPDEVIKAAVPPSEKKEIITTPADEVLVEDSGATPEENKRKNWMNILNAALPFLRPTDQEAFDQAQLYPEMAALAMNQEEGVHAQGYQPDLKNVSDISFQDQLNANQADFNSMMRQNAGNPAGMFTLAAQKYAANTGVLGSQFRANQAERSGIYNDNINTLNQAKLQNLSIYDRLADRQAQARANTKATTLAALSSMSDKMAKHKLENKTLGIYENLYNYRFGKDEVADNWNPLAQFNMQGRPNIGSSKDVAPEGYEYETILKKKKPSLATNSISNSKNGSIVKSYKNI